MRTRSSLDVGFGVLAAWLALLSAAGAQPEPAVNYEDLPSEALDAASYASCESASWSGFAAGADLVFAKPHFKESFQISATDALTGTMQMVPFAYDYAPCVRTWIGYASQQGLGLRATYWQYDQAGTTTSRTSDGLNIYGTHAVTIIFPATILADAPGETLTATDGLETQLIDLQATLHIEHGQLLIVGLAGLRYAKLEQTIMSTVQNAGGGVIGILDWSRSYEGLGPSVAAELRYPVGASGVTAVAGGGGALLFGSKQLERLAVGTIAPATTPPRMQLDDADEVVGIGQLSLGLEWERSLTQCTMLNLGAYYEGQLWAESGSPTLGFLGIEGFALRAGLRF